MKKDTTKEDKAKRRAREEEHKTEKRAARNEKSTTNRPRRFVRSMENVSGRLSSIDERVERLVRSTRVQQRLLEFLIKEIKRSKIASGRNIWVDSEDEDNGSTAGIVTDEEAEPSDGPTTFII